MELRHSCSWSEIVITEAEGDEASAFNLADPTIVSSALSFERTNSLNVPKIRNHVSRNMASVGANSKK
jgi:hypothetical protein